MRIDFIKAHGTRNDFVLIDDLENRLELTAAQVAFLCDRRGGIGADGMLRVVRDASDPTLCFMDYRNADGSVAEMCGNGARVFARYLVDAGYATGPAIRFVTRAGVLGAELGGDGTVTIEMGTARPIPQPKVPLVSVAGSLLPAVSVAAPNPHAVVFVEDVADAGALDSPPEVMPASAFPEGVNVEFVEQRASDHIVMRVFERGVGETASCGTGACAAAWAHLDGRAGTVQVDVPGGTVWVSVDDAGAVRLRGPVTFVAEGVVEVPIA